MYYTNYIVGGTVYFLEGTETVHRAKVVSITINHDNEGKTRVMYELVVNERNYFSRYEKDIFRSADSAFWSLDKPAEEPIQVDAEGCFVPMDDGVATGGTVAYSENFV